MKRYEHRGFGLFDVIAIVLIVLKTCGLISIGWLTIFLIWLIPVGILFSIMLIMYIVLALRDE